MQERVRINNEINFINLINVLTFIVRASSDTKIFDRFRVLEEENCVLSSQLLLPRLWKRSYLSKLLLRISVLTVTEYKRTIIRRKVDGLYLS